MKHIEFLKNVKITGPYPTKFFDIVAGCGTVVYDSCLELKYDLTIQAWPPLSWLDVSDI